VTANADDLEDDVAGEDDDDREGKGAGEDAGGHTAPQRDETTGLNPNNAGGHTAKNVGTGASKTAAVEMASSGSGERLSVTVKEAAALLHLSESYVRELRTKHKLRSPGRNKKLILMSSITRYQNEHQKAGETSSPTTVDQAPKNGASNHASVAEHRLPFPAYAADHE